jgi:hypothetical protein
MIQSDTARNTINFVVFQIGWFACVLFPGLGAVGLVVLIVAFHLAFISKARKAELQFIGAGVVIGGLLDGLWFNIGVLDNGIEGFQLTPIWILGLWAAFSTTLSHSLGWISAKPWLPYVCAPIAGPFAYWSASKMGAVELPDLTFSLLALAIGWLVVFPLLLYIRKTLYPELLQ